MKRLAVILILLVGLTFSSVGYALPDVTTKKADVSMVKQAETQADIYGVYEIVKLNAPEVFNVGKTTTNVYLYGHKKAEAYNYLVKEKSGKNIYIGNSERCYNKEILAVKICRGKQYGLNRIYKKAIKPYLRYRPSKDLKRYFYT